MRVVTKLMMGLSFPSPVPVVVKTQPTLPTNVTFIQSPPVWSRKLSICATVLPKRGGVEENHIHHEVVLSIDEMWAWQPQSSGLLRPSYLIKTTRVMGFT